MLSGRTYVVKSPALASQVQRSSSTLDFDQLIIEMTPRMVGLSADCKRILQDKTAKEEGRIRMVTQAHSVINPQLSPQRMDAVAAVQLQHFTDFVNAIPQGFETELYTFVTRELTAASMHTFYGPENPFAVHPELIEEFWNWECGIIAYMIGVFPSITARKAYNGLEKGVIGFIEYLEKGRDKDAHQLVQDRKALHDAEGISIQDQARLEMGLSFAFNSNASITIFWVLNNIFSRPDLLAEIREEIRENALVGANAISFAKLKECPLLNSVYRESMRLVAPMTSARFVLEDTIIADTYLLRKDTVVQIAGGVLHADTDVWGPDATSFNVRRFFYNLNGSKSNADGSISEGKSSQVHPAAFRCFGGGSSYCPGRHFAQMEIISLTAVLVYGFDLLPQTGKGGVKYDPPKGDKRFPFAVTKPLESLDVKMVRREGMEDAVWKLEL
jgi:cytochrome P450